MLYTPGDFVILGRKKDEVIGQMYRQFIIFPEISEHFHGHRFL